jgi:hypothetical protein
MLGFALWVKALTGLVKRHSSETQSMLLCDLHKLLAALGCFSNMAQVKD